MDAVVATRHVELFDGTVPLMITVSACLDEEYLVFFVAFDAAPCDAKPGPLPT
jgi:hypothetical protein